MCHVTIRLGRPTHGKNSITGRNNLPTLNSSLSNPLVLSNPPRSLCPSSVASYCRLLISVDFHRNFCFLLISIPPHHIQPSSWLLRYRPSSLSSSVTVVLERQVESRYSISHGLLGGGGMSPLQRLLTLDCIPVMRVYPSLLPVVPINRKTSSPAQPHPPRDVITDWRNFHYRPPSSSAT